MFSKFHSRKGFTLIELMIVVVIIGILAALAIPRFMQATVKSRQSEAKGILKQIYTMERTVRQENPAVGYVACADHPALILIGVDVPVGAEYAYSVTVLGTGFTATAVANLDDDATIDTWTINEDGTLTNTINDVTT